MQTERRLTSFSHGAGCGCKLGPEQLNEVLGTLSLPGVPSEVLVAADTGDDAAVYALDETGRSSRRSTSSRRSSTTRTTGRIAATNALSDVYAMGGTPSSRSTSWLARRRPAGSRCWAVSSRAAPTPRAVGVPVLGGHSITDPEPKYGMVVLGFVDRAACCGTRPRCRAGALVLTKPLGLGHDLHGGQARRRDRRELTTAVELMTTLNRAASEAVNEVGADAATDVTGFGLLGHLHACCSRAGVAAEIDASAVPLSRRARPRAQRRRRRRHAAQPRLVAPHVDWGESTEPEQLLLADAQTSGGLLVATDAGRLVELARADARRIGRTVVGRSRRHDRRRSGGGSVPSGRRSPSRDRPARGRE